MKLTKVFSIIALCAMTLVANAASINQVQINITGETGESEATLNLAQVDDVCSEFVMVTDGDAINVWAIVGTKKYSTYQNAGDLNGIAIGFKGNSNTNYTMTFNYVDGTVKIYDAIADSVIVPVEDGTYTFTCAANTEITDRFQVGEPETPFYPRDIANGNWGTFCYEEAISSVEGATVYEFKGKDATRVQVGTVTFPLTAGKAYLFNATADAQKFFYTDATKATQVTANNGLIGKFTEYTTTTDDADAYVIKGTSLVPAAVGSTVPANRAYVQKLSDIEGTITPGAPGRMIFNIVGTTTDLEAAEAAGMQDGKMIINGQLIIIKGGKMFNAQGAAL